MSTVTAKNLALQMASGELERLPRLTPDADPAYARDLLGAYYSLRDAVSAEVAERWPSSSIRDRIALTAVRQEIEAAILDARRWLSRIARRGGHGVPAVGVRP
jgi:hypothetical protein